MTLKLASDNGNVVKFPEEVSLGDKLRKIADAYDAGEFATIGCAHLLFECEESLVSFNLTNEDDVYLIGLLAVLQKRMVDDLGG